MSALWGNKSTSNQSKFQANTQTSMQAQTVDQNYANSILFMAMSALETYELKLRANKEIDIGIKENYEKQMKRECKEFGRYDKSDYSFKSIDQLKGQLRNSIMIMACSRIGFDKTYGQKSFQLPKNYDEEMAIERIKSFKQFFQSINDQDGYYLADDIEKIIGGTTTGLFYENMKLVEHQELHSNNQTLKNAMNATNQMREEEKRIVDQLGPNMSPTNLEFQVNPQHKINPKDQNENEVTTQIAQNNSNKGPQPQDNQLNKMITIDQKNCFWYGQKIPFAFDQKTQVVFFDYKRRQFYLNQEMQMYFYDDKNKKCFFKDFTGKEIFNEEGQQLLYDQNTQQICLNHQTLSKRVDLPIAQKLPGEISFLKAEDMKKIKYLYDLACAYQISQKNNNVQNSSQQMADV